MAIEKKEKAIGLGWIFFHLFALSISNINGLWFHPIASCLHYERAKPLNVFAERLPLR